MQLLLYYIAIATIMCLPVHLPQSGRRVGEIETQFGKSNSSFLLTFFGNPTLTAGQKNGKDALASHLLLGFPRCQMSLNNSCIFDVFFQFGK